MNKCRTFATKIYHFMKKLFILAFVLSSIANHLSAQTVKVNIANMLDQQRKEIVEIDTADIAKRLGSASEIIVRNALGQEIAHQITYDGKLLFEVSVSPKRSVEYSIEKGKPQTYESFVYGQVWSDRLDDLTWENDLGIYRMYGPALQRTGERSFGTDLWTKSTPRLDVVKRYESEFSVRDTIRLLRSQGKRNEAWQVESKISYHLDHGTGFDAYGVGPTLGCGAPALMSNGKLVLPYCWQKCEIKDNGPLRFTVLLTYGNSTIGNDKNVVEHRLVSLDKGSYYNKMTVWYDGLSKAFDLASGVVVHTADTTSISLADDCILYADPTDRPSQISQQVYVGTLYPDAPIVPKYLGIGEKVQGVAGHAVGIVAYKPDTRFTYYFGSAWSGGNVPTWQEWQLRSRLYLEALRSPLKVSF